MVAHERLAGELADFERAHDAASVAGQDLFGRLGIALREHGMQGRRAPLLELGRPAGPHVGVGTREVERVDDRADVERRSPDHDRRHAATQAVGHDVAGHALELRDAARLGDVQDVEEVMGHAAALVGRRLGRADVHAAVQLHRVGVDHFRVAEPAGERDGEIGLA